MNHRVYDEVDTEDWWVTFFTLSHYTHWEITGCCLSWPRIVSKRRMSRRKSVEDTDTLGWTQQGCQIRREETAHSTNRLRKLLEQRVYLSLLFCSNWINLKTNRSYLYEEIIPVIAEAREANTDAPRLFWKKEETDALIAGKCQSMTDIANNADTNRCWFSVRHNTTLKPSENFNACCTHHITSRSAQWFQCKRRKPKALPFIMGMSDRNMCFPLIYYFSLVWVVNSEEKNAEGGVHR